MSIRHMRRLAIAALALTATGGAIPAAQKASLENGQSRIYLGLHWSFDKTQGIAQGRRVARFVLRNAFGPRTVRF